MTPGLVDRLLLQQAAQREEAEAGQAAGQAAQPARRAAPPPRQRTDVSLFGLGQLPWHLLKVGGAGWHWERLL